MPRSNSGEELRNQIPNSNDSLNDTRLDCDSDDYYWYEFATPEMMEELDFAVARRALTCIVEMDPELSESEVEDFERSFASSSEDEIDDLSSCSSSNRCSGSDRESESSDSCEEKGDCNSSSSSPRKKKKSFVPKKKKVKGKVKLWCGSSDCEREESSNRIQIEKKRKHDEL
jgi:hypothetical protein